ncbi:MAG: hypothetical protein Q4D51_09750 [Eubacteriales bacterium]|nr:hypothetical protein [Eubacteriales bacterium]
MRTLIEIGVFEKSILFILIILGVFLAINLFMNHRQEKRYLPYMLVDGFCLFISYMEFNLLVIAMSSLYDGKIISGWRIGFINEPVMLYFVVQFLIVGIETCLFINDVKWRRNHLSRNSIKESLDSMPYGICCYYESGMPRLINQEMQHISEELFGEKISNASIFWEQINSETLTTRAKRMMEYSTPTWILDGGKVLSFIREKIRYENSFLYEILATDITEEYKKSKQLLVDNERMRIVTDKLKEYSKNVTRLIIEKEVLDAKVRVHSELGQTLVATRRYLAAHDMDEKELLGMWNKNIKLLKKEGSNVTQDDYEILQVNAKQLGISITMPDILPANEEIKEVIIAAGNECITNAYKYAENKALVMNVSHENNHFILQIWNEGDVPTEEIREKGGLCNLRKMIETKGGTMKIASKPFFGLTITMEKR